MKNRLILYLAAGAILLALAVMIDRSFQSDRLLRQYAADIALFTGIQESDARSWINVHKQQLRSWRTLSTQKPELLTGALQNTGLDQATFTVLLHKRDSLFFWSNNKFVPGNLQLSRLDRLSGRRLERLPAGYFALYSEPFDDATLSCLIPIQYTLEGTAAIRHPFPANPQIPPAVYLSEIAGKHPVVVEGQSLAWLETSGSLQPGWVQWLKFGAYAFIFLLLSVRIHQWALQLAGKHRRMAGLAFAVGAGLLVLLGNNLTGFTAAAFDNLPLFSHRFEKPIMFANSLGDWLLYLFLLIWVAVNLHKAMRFKQWREAPRSARVALGTGLNYLAMAGLLLVVDLLYSLVFFAGIDFNVGEVLNLKLDSFAALAGIVLSLSVLFLIAHRLFSSFRDLRLGTYYRIASQLGALALFFASCLVYPKDMLVNPLILCGFALIFVLIYDVFVHWNAPGFSWIIVWLSFFSLLAAFLLHRYNQEKDRMLRQEYARALATERDAQYAEPLLPGFLEQARTDSLLPLLLKPWPFKPENNSLTACFSELCFRQQYLFEQYRVKVFAFDGERQALVRGQSESWSDIMDDYWSQGKAIDGQTDIRFTTGKDGVFRYMLKLRRFRMNDPSQPAEIFCFLEHEFTQTSKAYTRLYYHLPYKNLQFLDRYDFSVLRNEDKIIAEKGQINRQVLLTPLANGEGREVYTNDPRRLDAVFRSADGHTTAIVGKAASPWYRQVYVFAILFTFITFLLLVLAGINAYVPILPAYFHFSLSTQGSLARRIHFWNIILIVLAFLALGVLTYRHFSRTARENAAGNDNFRAEAVLNNLRSQLGDHVPGMDSLGPELRNALEPFVKSLAIDVNLYDHNGNLLYSSQPGLQSLGIIPLKMNRQALFYFEKSRQNDYYETQDALFGQTTTTRYLPVRNYRNQTLAYLGIPFHPARQTIGPEVSDFIGMLASLYVFLLIIAGTATLALARSIIRPISLISDKIKELRFEDQNQPLEYKGDSSDELSDLIEEYNRMVDKLEASRNQLIRLERESAWREMARQIAHDIKNPLTTMKLSMQQLERVSNDPEQAAAYLKKAITRLIEQIDSLAQIASEFSMFANLDIRQRQDLVINDVVESVYDLFTEQKEVELLLNMPEERFVISGDKSHLIRVFNNLVINAIQAIPEGRRGRINMLLYARNGTAVVQVRDNGGGIPPDIQKRVFQPNFTTKTSGSGLGLAICRRIVEALDGNIRFETRAGEGTDFFVEFPIVGREGR